MSDTMYDYDCIIKAILDGYQPVFTKSKRKPHSIQVVCNGKVIECYLVTGPVIQDNGPEIDATLFRVLIDEVTNERKVELYTKTIWPRGETILPVARQMYLEAWGSELKPRTIMRIPGEYGSISF